MKYILFDKVRKRITGEKNDCTVMALAIVTGIKYIHSHYYLWLKGRELTKGFDLKFNPSKKLIYINYSPHKYSIIKKYNNKKVKTFIKNINDNENSYLIITKNHCLALKKGKIYDNKNSENFIIEQIIKILY